MELTIMNSKDGIKKIKNIKIKNVYIFSSIFEDYVQVAKKEIISIMKKRPNGKYEFSNRKNDESNLDESLLYIDDTCHYF